MNNLESLMTCNELMNREDVMDDPRIFSALMDARDKIRADMFGQNWLNEISKDQYPTFSP